MAKTKKLDLAELVKSVDVSVSNSDTGNSSTVIDIPREKIMSHSENFYELTGIDQLADSIALNGLLQPILVKPDGENYVILSGHRRNAAMDKLDWPTRPCIVKTPVNEILEELMLIEANRTARVISSADTMRQAERYTELLSKLKESGVEIHGRLRDAVAEAMQVSASKLARLHKIQTALSKQWMKEFNKNNIAESVAYALAQLPEEQQQFIYDKKTLKDNNIKYLREYEVERYGNWFKNLSKIKPCKLCKDKASGCSHTNEMIERHRKTDEYHNGCHAKCCYDCWDKDKCKDLCKYIKPEVDAVKKKQREENAKNKSAEKTKAQNLAVDHSVLWMREGWARDRAKVSIEDAVKCFEYAYGTDKKLEEYERGDIAESSEYGETNPIRTIGLRGYIKLADLYGVSVDYLLCRSDRLQSAAPEISWMKMKDKPSSGQHCFVIMLMPNGNRHVREAWYLKGKFCMMDNSDSVIDLPILGWLPLPALPGETTNEVCTDEMEAQETSE